MMKTTSSLSSSLKAFIVGVLLTLTLAWLSVLGGLQWINFKIHDHALNLSLSRTTASASVIINNDLNLDQTFDRQLTLLLDSLTKNKARHIVLVTRIPQVASAAVQHLVQSQRPIFLATPPNMTARLAGLNLSTLKQVDLFSLTTIDGITRQFALSRSHPSLIDLYDSSALVGSENRYFNYFLDLDSLPNLTLSQAVKGGLIEELVANKVVLIDLDYHQGLNAFHIPGPNAASSVSLTQIQALAAETVIGDSHLRRVPILLSLGVLLLTYAFYFFLLQLLSPKGVLLFASAALLSTYGLSVVALFHWHYLLPMVEWIAVQVLTVFYLLGIERLREETLILNMSASLNARLCKKVQPPSFYQSSDPWDNLHAMLDQQLNLQRSIFLTKVPKDHRVIAIHALNCAIDDIMEKRRDFQRSPYSLTLSTLKPYKLEKPYFASLQQDELQYLCPLVFGGKVLGFWALTVIPTDGWHQASFENNLIQFSREITELLYHRRSYLRENVRQGGLLRRILGLKLAQAEYQVLVTSLSMLEKRFDSLQSIFDGMSTASTLYNLFGQILYANHQMEVLVKQWQLAFYSLSAHDFLIALTALDSAQIKQRLLQVTINNVEVCLNIVYQDQPTHYILRIRPIEVSNDNKEEGVPFLLLGLLFEFIDISEAQQLLTMKKDLYTQYFHQMRNNLGELYLISRQLGRQLPPDNPLLEMLNQTLDECTKANVNIEQKLALHRSLTSTIVPLNPYSEWKKITRSNEEAIARKHIRLVEHVPTILSMVLAEPMQLAQLLLVICELLINDSDSSDAAISLLVTDSYQTKQQANKRIVTMRFSNQGYGVPESHLTKLSQMDPAKLTGSDELLDKLFIQGDSAKIWGLNLNINSVLGAGYVIELSIPAFLVN